MNIKLVVWDLDDTLWRGTLAEGDNVSVFEHRAEIVRKLNRCGIVSSICSKNDPASAMQVLESHDLWDQFVFARIAFTPKGEAVRQIIEDMQLRAMNVLFIDDSDHNLNEVKALLPDIHTINSALPGSDLLLNRILHDNRHITKSRLEDYRILQSKLNDRASQAVSNEAFLRSSNIEVTVLRWMDTLEFAGRIEELINRATQLNYTESRVEPGTMPDTIMNIRHIDTQALFAWDKYGYYGLVGVAMVEPATAALLHFVFSCRIMHMGVEAFMLSRLRARYPHLDVSRLKKEVPDETPDWIKELPFLDTAARSKITSTELPDIRKSIALRIMYDCQSGGIAHFSRWREVTDFDNSPRLFSMPMVLADEYEKQSFPPLLVYGAGVDYLDWRWAGRVAELRTDIYSTCVRTFCAFIETRGCKMLVVLPPLNAPDDKYCPSVHSSRSHTRARGIEFNRIWRDCVKGHPAISLLDLSPLIQPDDMLDASHYYPRFLKTLAGYIDFWSAPEMARLSETSGCVRA